MDTQEDKKPVKVYEVGYLLTAQLPEEKIGGEVTRLKSVLEKNGAFVLSDEFPKLRTLAYTIEKSVAGKNEKHTTAYFGWIKFESTPADVIEIKNDFAGDMSIVRFIIVKTEKEIPPMARFSFHKKPEATEKSEDKKLVTSPKQDSSSEDKPKMSDAEIDKTIEELVVE